MVTATGSRPAAHIPSLDGLRAVAFLTVFVAHAQIFPQFPGNFGVTIFFFLSGFLITTLLRLESEQAGRVSFRQFYLRRVLRIFPPFYLILGTTAAMAAVGLAVGGVGLAPVVTQMLHLSNYRLIFGGYSGIPLGTYPYWSLAVEEHFYLLFPLAYMLLRRHVRIAKQQAMILLAFCGIILLWRCALVFGFDPSKDRTYIATDTRVDSILFGCVLAIWGNPVLDPRWASDRLLKYVLLPLGMVALLISFVLPPPILTETIRYTIQGLALVPVFTVAILYPTWGPVRILNLPPVRFLGLLSYSLYLMHEVIIFNLYPHVHANHLLQAAGALAVSVALATVIYFLLERPCARLRKRLSYRTRGSSQTAIADQSEAVQGHVMGASTSPVPVEA